MYDDNNNNNLLNCLIDNKLSHLLHLSINWSKLLQTGGQFEQFL